MPLDDHGIRPPAAAGRDEQSPAVESSGAMGELLAAIDRFSLQEVASRRPRPELPLTREGFAAIATAAADAGLLDVDAEGYGLWSCLARRDARTGADHPDDPAPRAFTLAALHRIAADDAAVAWQLHGLALANAALALAGLDDGDENAATRAHAGRSLVLDGSLGIGGSALGRRIAARAPHGDDAALLADVFGARPRHLLLSPEVSEVVVLRFAGSAFRIERHTLRDGLLHRDTHPHGLDGCHLVTWQPRGAALASAQVSDAVVGRLLAAQQAAQMAIALGALAPAMHRAHDYARLRRQGGQVIAMHDAVATLLADMDTAGLAVDALLAGMASHAGDAPQDEAAAVRAALAARLAALPLLSRAANAAMQVHGGIGYMRDTGVEHMLRAVNTLALQGGAAPEVALLLAAMQPHDNATPLAVLPAEHADSARSLHAVTAPHVVTAPHAVNRSHLAGHLPRDHRLSPATAFRGVPLLRRLSHQQPLDPWELDTQSLPRPLAALRRRVRDFALRECAPRADAADLEQHDGHVPSASTRALLQRAARAGLLTDILPSPIGSAPPAQFLHSLALQQAIRVEELARVDGGLMLLLSAHALGLCPLLLSGDLALINRVVRPAFRRTAAGDPQVFAFAITEPAAGSDAEEGHGALLQSPGVRARTAQRHGRRGWQLSGRKVFISGGDIARYVTVFAALDGEGYEGWTCFLVDAQSPGFRVARCEMKMGMRASGAAELEFDDCFVPAENVIGGLRNGWALARATLNLSRLPVAAMGVGFAQHAVDIATDFACRETLAGRPLIHRQQVQCTLADLQAETCAIRQLVWHHARGWRARQDGAALCKFQATDRAQVVVERAMELLGCSAVRHDQKLERVFRDVRLTRIFEGTNQLNRLAVIEEQQPLLLARIAARHGPG